MRLIFGAKARTSSLRFSLPLPESGRLSSRRAVQEAKSREASMLL